MYYNQKGDIYYSSPALTNSLKDFLRKKDATPLVIVVALFFFFTVLLFYRSFLITDPSRFLETYKYFTSDSYDWIVNGIYYFKDSSISLRNPGLPLIIKPLWGLNLLWLLPYINAVAFIVLIFTVNRSVNYLTGSIKISILVSVIMFLNFELLDFSKYILADLYAVLFIALALHFALTSRKNLTYLFLGISTLFQNFAYFIFVVWFVLSLIDILSKSKENWRIDRQLLITTFKTMSGYLLMFLLPLIPIYIYKTLAFGDPIYSGVSQFDLLRINLNSLFYYTVSIIDLYTMPVLLLCALAGVYYIKNKKVYYYRYLLSGLLIAIAFWVFAYDWNDKRFMLYLLPFLYLMLGDGFFYLSKLLRNNILIRNGVIVLFAITALIQGFTPASSFFVADEIVILPSYKIVVSSGFQEGYGTYLIRDFSFRRNTHLEVLEVTPFIQEKVGSRYFKTEPNNYSYYNDIMNDRLDTNNKSFCIKPSEAIDFYTLNSVMKINKGYTLADLTIQCETDSQ